MTGLKLITFDAMNTFLKPAKSVGYQYAAVAKHFGFIVDAKAINQFFPSIFKSYWETYPNFGATHGMSSEDWWRGVITSTMSRAGFCIPETDFVRQGRFDYFVAQLYQVIILNIELLLLLIKTMVVCFANNCLELSRKKVLETTGYVSYCCSVFGI